jgi:hypothetical protein
VVDDVKQITGDRRSGVPLVVEGDCPESFGRIGVPILSYVLLRGNPVAVRAAEVRPVRRRGD